MYRLSATLPGNSSGFPGFPRATHNWMLQAAPKSSAAANAEARTGETDRTKGHNKTAQGILSAADPATSDMDSGTPSVIGKPLKDRRKPFE